MVKTSFELIQLPSVTILGQRASPKEWLLSLGIMSPAARVGRPCKTVATGGTSCCLRCHETSKFFNHILLVCFNA